MKGKHILAMFGFDVQEEPQSIYAFSPVYHVKNETGDIIIKRTQSLLKHGNQLMNYINLLNQSGISVVSPISLPVENPQLIGDETYVAYPFITGKTYTSTKEEIFEAGRLLGRIHDFSPSRNTFDLLKYDVFDFNKEEVEESVQNMEKYSNKNGVQINSLLLKEKLLKAVSQQNELKNSSLPWVATPHDYKANNLIFTPAPYLIDPDNASWIPRIFDLALALLLFHNELESAPKRIFTLEEWSTFISGYGEVITLTELEKEYWEKALEHVFLDEVMWLMAEVEEDWFNPSQQKLFVSLIEFMTSAFDKYKLAF